MSFPITKSCNFNCIYCGDGGEATASKSNIIDLETIKKTTEVAIKNNIKKFRITGGEPFLHPKIGEILDFFSDLGYYTLVNTNGTMIMENKEIINRLNSNIKFAVSFDTFDENLSKFISGHNKVDLIIEGIKLLKEKDHLLRLNTVVNNKNYKELDKIFDFCNELNCDSKLLDIVSVPSPYGDRNNLYQEISTLEEKLMNSSERILAHEYTRGFGTPCKRYKVGNIFVTIKNSVKGSHYDIEHKDGICRECNYIPCHEGLYDIFCLPDGRLCSCRWTEKQKFENNNEQLQYLIEVFKRSIYYEKNTNTDMPRRLEFD